MQTTRSGRLTRAPVREPTTSEDSEGELTASSDSGGSAAAHSDTSSPDEAAAASPTPPVAEAHGGGTRRTAPAKRSQSTLDRFFGNGRGAGAAASKQDGREGLQCSMARCPEPNGRPDDMLVCSRAACGQAAHPECLNFGEELARVVRSRDDWLCTDCKRCSVCLANTHDRLLVYCDDCDRAVHTFCAEPKLKAVPRGRWTCAASTHQCAARTVRSRRSSGSAKRQKRAARSLSECPPLPLAPSGTTEAHAAVSCSSGSQSPSVYLGSPRKGAERYQPEAEDVALFRRAMAMAARVASPDQAVAEAQGFGATPTSQLEDVVIDGYARLGTIHLCGFCLQYLASDAALARHMEKPHAHHPPHPPGDEVYRKGRISLWEVDGRKSKIYCQNLCLLAKLFLDTKTLYYDVEPFLFYVLTEWDDYGAHFVGYFSKEKESFLNYNLSCILVLPSHQRKGYGQALIDFSYLLSRKEGKVGTPEKPLSDLGLLTYRHYWRGAILDYLAAHPEATSVSIKDISDATAINMYDIVSTLQSLSMVKYWRGKHVLKVDDAAVQRHRAQRRASARRVTIEPSALRWTPYLAAPS